MFNTDSKQHAIDVDLGREPLAGDVIDRKIRLLKSAYRSQQNFVLALVVLAAGVSYRAHSLGFDAEGELLKISLYIGAWFGLFAGVMIDGSKARKLLMVAVGVVVSSAAGLFGSMLLLLLLGQETNWITSVNILASALGCMWLLTYFDEVLRGLDSLKTVSRQQLNYIDKAAVHFDELQLFVERMQSQGRMPVLAEYWAFRDFVAVKANSS